MKPVLGYASTGAAIIALREQGLKYREIGDMLGMPADACSSLCVKTKQRASRSVRTVKVAGNLFLDLESEASRRGTTASELAQDLLETVVMDKLYAAVLD